MSPCKFEGKQNVPDICKNCGHSLYFHQTVGEAEADAERGIGEAIGYRVAEKEIKALRERIDALTKERDKFCVEAHEVTLMRQEEILLKEAAESSVRELAEAICWALGQHGEFRERRTGEGAYWWRTELRQRAFQSRETPPSNPLSEEVEKLRAAQKDDGETLATITYHPKSGEITYKSHIDNPLSPQTPEPSKEQK